MNGREQRMRNITDFKEFDRFNTLYREYFPSAPPPARWRAPADR
jgi:hypothetical protein